MTAVSIRDLTCPALSGGLWGWAGTSQSQVEEGKSRLLHPGIEICIQQKSASSVRLKSRSLSSKKKTTVNFVSKSAIIIINCVLRRWLWWGFVLLLLGCISQPLSGGSYWDHWFPLTHTQTEKDSVMSRCLLCLLIFQVGSHNNSFLFICLYFSSCSSLV